MVFTPVIPSTGIVGWNFLQATYDRQLESFSNSAQISADNDYMVGKLSSPISVEEFLDDPRLRRTTMMAFGLEGEEWKRGFISKVLNEVNDPESSFLTRLNNSDYTNFAETLNPLDGQIRLSADAIAEISEQFKARSFRSAVGEADNDMRLNLNYQAEIGNLITNGSDAQTNMYRVLGSVPVRTVLETALGLPSDVSQLDIDQQVEIFQDALQSSFRIDDVNDLTSAENIERVIQRYSAISAISNGPSPSTPGATALTLLSGIGSTGSQNLFLSGF